MARSPTVSRESRSLTRSEDRVWEMKERRNNIRERERERKRADMQNWHKTSGESGD